MAHWSDEYLNMVADCEQRSADLTEWETGFIASIRSRLERGGILTAKQIETLDTIWHRATSHTHRVRG
jgi:hypothetical protein